MRTPNNNEIVKFVSKSNPLLRSTDRTKQHDGKKYGRKEKQRTREPRKRSSNSNKNNWKKTEHQTVFAFLFDSKRLALSCLVFEFYLLFGELFYCRFGTASRYSSSISHHQFMFSCYLSFEIHNIFQYIISKANNNTNNIHQRNNNVGTASNKPSRYHVTWCDKTDWATQGRRGGENSNYLYRI